MFKVILVWRAVVGRLRLPLHAAPLAADSQESKSAPLARQLTQLLDAGKTRKHRRGRSDRRRLRRRALRPRRTAPGRLGQVPDCRYRRSPDREEGIPRAVHGPDGGLGRRVTAGRQRRQLRRLRAKPKRDAAADSWERDNKTHVFEGHKKAKLSERALRQGLHRRRRTVRAHPGIAAGPGAPEIRHVTRNQLSVWVRLWSDPNCPTRNPPNWWGSRDPRAYRRRPG